MKKLLYFTNDEYKEYPLETSLKLKNIEFFHQQDGIKYKKDEKVEDVILQTIYELDGIKFIAIDNKSSLYFKKDNIVLIGKEDSDIIINTGKIVIDNEKIVNEENTIIYVNGKLFNEKEIVFNYGDQVLIGEFLFVFYSDFIEIMGNKNLYKTELIRYRKNIEEIEAFPNYKRSPRIIKRLNYDKVSISKPPSKIERKKGSLAKIIIPPIVMAIGTITMSLIMGRGIYMMIGLAGTVVSLVFSVTTYFSDKKELNEKNEKRTKVYENYLLGMRKKLNNLKQSEIDAFAYNNPKLKELEMMVKEYNARIFERDVNDDDFLTICVGNADDRSEYQVSFDYDLLKMENDELLDEANEICKEYQTIEEKPILVDLKKAHLGIVGEKREVHEQLKCLLAQITFFHSYHDVEVIFLYNEEFKSKFDYIKWYPHVKMHEVNLTGNIYNERIRDQVLGSLHQILKDRKVKRDEEKKESKYLPHYIIIVDDYNLVINHSIMEYLQESSTELGFSLIYTAQKRANLPENIKTVILVEDINTITLLLNEGIEINKKINSQKSENIDLEQMARDLSVIKHIKGINSQIPEAITFFEMYKIKNPQELNIIERWKKGESHKSLAVPIGIRAKDDIVELNLHEKAHGPHGLVAGTTGSGKSEIIQTYILSLAINYSPYEVGFLLIDYKGGGMANLFRKLPHLLGTITNLDGAESMRALASIKAELARRQRIFNKYEVNNINKYNQLFKKGKAEEALPHLFLISDEFAELKKEQPEFMSELISVARIGRTLGVHLILATQKPTGVVDDQIWSNSKFKLALKVQNEGDSKEIIKTSDAAFITQAGRAYLQVGNNEIYELFQSAWSGATYSDKEVANKIDDRIYRINLLGQMELINKNLSDEVEEKESMTTQLDAIVEYIREVYLKNSYKEVTKPWLPPLGNNIVSPHIDKIIDVSGIKSIDLACPIGIVDIPEEQKQIEYIIDFIKDGNFAIFSSSGYGKSFSIGTILLSLAIKNNPMLLNCYILDFGNSSLITYKALPHVADYMNFDSDEKLTKFRKLMEKEIKNRKQLFAKEEVQNFDMYNKINPENKLKAIFIFIDNFDVVKELSHEFEEFITKTTRDGVGLGIYTVISATRANSVRFAILNNFKNKMVQYLFDSSDVTSLLGRSPYQLNEIKGRALVKQKNISMMQVYSPVAFEDDIEYINNLKELVKQINNSYTGERILGIPVLPDIFTTKDFKNFKCETVEENLVGLSLDEVENVSLNKKNSPFLIVGQSQCGKTNLLHTLISQDKGKYFIFDSNSRELFKYRHSEKAKYIATEDDVTGFVEELFNEVEKRKRESQEALSNGEISTPTQYLNSLEEWTIYIDDLSDFIKRIENIKNLSELLMQASKLGISIIATVSSVIGLKGFDEVTKFFKTVTNGAILGQVGNLTMFNINMRDIPSFGYAILYENGKIRKIKLPKYIEH
ncbi:MAG: type VII secretion protein EssC [Clostridium paraputrificum]